MRTYTFADDFYSFRRRKPRRLKSLQGDAQAHALATFDALRATAKPMPVIGGRLILPEAPPVGCPRMSFGRPCGRVDFHAHDEAFGGATGKYLTMGSSPRPRKQIEANLAMPVRTYLTAETRDIAARKMRRTGCKIRSFTIERTSSGGDVVTLFALEQEV